MKEKKSTQKSVNISKGIILTFCTIYLIIYGVAIELFINDMRLENPTAVPIYMAYFPLLCYVAAVFLGVRTLIFVKTANQEKLLRTKSTKRKGKTSIYKQAIYLIVFVFLFIPLIAPAFDHGINYDDFSIYNEEWNGCSDLRQMAIDEGYAVANIQSSLSATERLDKRVLLVLLGPNSFYNPLYEIPYFVDFFANSKNSLLMCHDHGSTSTLLLEIWAASLIDQNAAASIPFTTFPDGILRDNLSFGYKLGEDGKMHGNPTFPVINRSIGGWANHPIASGIGTTGRQINNVIMSNAGVTLSLLTELSGFDIIGRSSVYSFLDKNNDGMYDIEDDGASIPFGFVDMIASQFPNYEALIGALDPIPTGGFPQAVFMAKDTGAGRVFVSTDASMFNNELLTEPGYDNLQFAKNIINWLTYGDKEDWVIVFDEAHIVPTIQATTSTGASVRYNTRDISSAGIYGFIMQYIVHLSTNPITAWIYPLLAIYTLRKYVPKKDSAKDQKKKAEKEDKKEEKEKFRTSSFFAKKIEWYREKHKYGKALMLLYRRMERKLNSLLRGETITTQSVVEMVRAKEGRLNKVREKKLTSFMDKMLKIKAGKLKVKKHDEFEKLFFQMEDTANSI